jgi:hypothetical protein
MNQRTEYLLQVFEKIGAPLMSSILQAQGRGMADETQKDALRIAELLAKTTQASIEISRAIDFSVQPDQGDALRVALAALASGLIGSYYKHSGKAPGDNDLKKMTSAMQTVLTFSDNFVPGGDAATRMENLSARGQQVDAPQAALQYIHAFIPVVNAITAFPFGQAEQKLIMDVSNRILQRATELRVALFPDLAPSDIKRIELSLISVIAEIYAACHTAETTRLMSLTEDQRTNAGLGPDSVWKAFDLRLDILETLARSLVPGSGQGKSGGGSKAPSAQIPAQPSAQPPIQQAPVAPPPQTANPMSMFSKSPASPPPAGKSQNSAPPAAGNPMGFFKAPPKNSDGQ